MAAAKNPTMAFDVADGRACAIAIPPDDSDSQTQSLVNTTAMKGVRAVVIGGDQTDPSKDAFMPAGSVVANSDRLWTPGQTVTYSFLAGTSQQQAKVNTVVKEWFPYANVVFQPAASGGMLRITFDPKLGSWSYVGRDNLRIVSTASATMNFGWVKDTKAIAEEERGVILHEFGHVLGLLHEHQSPARGGTITLDEEAVYGYYGYTQGWSRETVKAQIIDVFNAEKLISNYSRLDIKSIMMYFMPSWLNLQHIDVKANYALSDIDKAYMVINYPRNGSHADAPQWTLDYALRVADVDAVTTEAIRKARGDVGQIRFLFTAYQLRARLSEAIDVAAIGIGRGLQNGDDEGDGEVRIPEGEEPEGDFGWCGAELPEQMSTPIVLNPGEDEIEDRGIAVSGVDAARGVFEADDDRGRRIQLWAPYTTLNYGFLNPEKATPYRRARVANALLLFAQNSSLTFRERDLRGVDLDNEDNRREHPIRIFFGERIAGTLTLGVLGWSSVGRRQIDGTPRGWRNRGVKWTSVYMNDQPLNSDDELDKDSLNWANNTLYHELLHALGMEHEQDSEHTLLKEPRDTRQTFISTAFDHDSVMLYRDLAYRDAQAYGKVTHLNPWPSPTDLDLLRLLYPDNELGGKFAAALVTMQFTDQERTTLLADARRAVGSGRVPNTFAIKVLRDRISASFQGNPRLSTRTAEEHNPSPAGRLGQPPDAAEPAHGLGPAGDERRTLGGGAEERLANGLDAARGVENELAHVGWCAAELLAMAEESETNPDALQRAVYVPVADERGQRQLWLPYDTIRYGFLNPDQATPHRRRRLHNALRLYEQNSSLRFVKAVDEDISSIDFSVLANREKIPLRVWFGRKWESMFGILGYASLGTQACGESKRKWNYFGPLYTSLYLSDQPATQAESDKLTADELGFANNTLYHELGHVMGFHHEQDSPQTRVEGGNINPRTLGTAWDAKSIMLYEGFRYLNSNEKTEAAPYPSGTDLDLLRLMYPDNRTDGKLAAALITMDFTAAEQVNILNLAENALGPGTVVSDYRLEALRMAITAGLQRKPRLSLRPSIPYDPNREYFYIQDMHDIRAPLEDVPDIGRGVQNGTQPPFDPRANPSTPGFLSQLIQKLQEIFTPLSNQQFTLQFPGRYLDRESYAWDTSSAGPYGQFIKPVVVNESEFRLVDQMYDIAPVVAGPNGQNLSIIYNQVLNNLLPKFVENGLAQQQDQIRRWMLREVPMTQWIRDIMARQHAREQDLAASIAAANSARLPKGDESGGTPDAAAAVAFEKATVPQPVFDISNKAVGETLNRIELSELLMNEYLYTKQDWELERDRLINQATQADLGTKESQRSLNALTRQLAHITDTRQAQLASKYADAVVRGYTHTVRQYMGYLDISNPAEALQDAKDSYREAAMSSLDGSMNVFPVQLTPLDWFVGLTTSFTLEDLTQDPEVIRLQISAKSNELDSLNSNLVALEMGSTGDVEALRKQVSDAQDALTVAQGQVAEKYTSNVVALAQTYLTKLGDVDVTRLALALKVAPEALAPLKEQMKSVQLAQDALLKSTRALSQLTAASALAEATDTRQQQQQIRLQIQTTIAELKELQTRFASLTAKTGGADAVRPASQEGNEVPTTPPVLPDEGTSGGSRWQTIMFTSRADERQRANAHSSNAKVEQWNLNMWLASGSGGSSSEDAAASQASVDSSDTIDIAFRATLVTVDRGGWFQPQFFSESRAFYKVNPEISWAGPRGLLQGFPIAYLLVKDVVVRVTHQYIASASEKRNEAESAASAGGFLCFSYSSSSSSTSGSESSSYQQFSNGYIVKIPGPQILGYMVQLTGPDESELMPAELPKDFFIPDDEYERTLLGEDGQPVDPSRGLEPEARKLEITEEKLKKAMDAMLNEKVGELFRTLVAEESEPRR